nr:hypothetical protein BaRGS_000426 [Batillaria attramentaria]
MAAFVDRDDQAFAVVIVLSELLEAEEEEIRGKERKRGKCEVNNIQRPPEYEAAIRSKERAKEDIQVAKQERPRLLTEANTTKREAESEARIIINKAESDARILQNKANSEADAIRAQYEKEAEAYESIVSSQGLQFTPEGFISYMGVRVISSAKNPVYIGLDSPAKTSYAP